jgi:hypothetical protein
MRAFWVVLDHPYGVVTDSQGKFTLADLPAGEVTLTIWHEKSGWIDKARKVRVVRGKTTDLGTIEAPLWKFADR